MENSIGMSSGQDNTSSPVLTLPADSQSPSVEQKDRSFTQSEVNDLIGKAKREAVERDRRTRDTQPAYAEPKSSEATTSSYQSNEDAIRKIVAEETQRQREVMEQQVQERTQMDQAQSLVNKFYSRLESGKEKYQDFNSVVGNIDLRPFGHAIQVLTEGTENTADVFYELSKNPIKLHELQSLAERPYGYQIAMQHVKKLSDSIKENESASRIRLPNEPLSQLRPTQTGANSDGSLSFKDLKMKYKG